MSLIDCIFSTNIFKSKSEIRRLIQQGAVKINGEKIKEIVFMPENDMTIQIGRGNVFKLIFVEQENKSKKLVKSKN